MTSPQVGDIVRLQPLHGSVSVLSTGYAGTTGLYTVQPDSLAWIIGATKPTGTYFVYDFLLDDGRIAYRCSDAWISLIVSPAKN